MRTLTQRQFTVALLCFLAVNFAGWAWFGQTRSFPQVTPEFGPAVKIQARLPVRELTPQAERVSVVFDVPPPAQPTVGEIEDAPPFRITPSIAGHWEWGAANRLDFVPDAPLPGGRVYRVETLADAEVVLGQPVVLVSGEKFETPGLQIQKCELLTCASTQVTFEVTFDQTVDPGTLLRHLTVSEATEESISLKSDYQPELTILTQQPAKTLTVQAHLPRSPLLRISVEKGLTGQGAEIGLRQNYVAHLRMMPVFAGLRAEAETPRTNRIVEVSTRFSRALQLDQPVPVVAAQPTVNALQVALRGGSSELSLSGEFLPGRTYTLTVPETLRSADGVPLGEAARFTVTIPEREPSVLFARSGGILSPGGHLQVDLETVGVGRLRVSAQRVHANNLVRHLLGESYGSELGRQVLEQTYNLPADDGHPKSHVIDLKALLGQPLGIYDLEARAKDQAWTWDSSTVTVTDLGLVGKQDRQGLWAWVGSIQSAQPQAGVKVSAWSRSNQKLVEGLTGADGTVRLPLSSDHPDGRAWVLIAESGNDLSYLPLEGTGWMLDGVSQVGRPYAETYEAFVYPERGIYRPGETVHLTGLVRDMQGLLAPQLPLEIVVRRPDGRVAETKTLTPKPEHNGFFQVDFETQASAMTGVYRVAVRIPGADEHLGETELQVEAFVPARMAVEIEPEHALVLGENPAAVRLQGRYLFGQPAADLPANAHVTYQATAFHSAAHPDFQFQPARAVEEKAAISTQHHDLTGLTLDAAGQHRLVLPAPQSPEPLRWQVRVVGTVTEPGGRSLSKSTTLIWDRATRHVGTQCSTGYIVPVNVDFAIRFVGRTPDDTPVDPGELHWTLYRLEYDSVLRTSGQYTFWSSRERAIEAQQGTVPADQWKEGGGEFPVQCPVAGRYRLIVRDLLSGTATELSFTASLNPDESHSMPLDQPDELQITLDQERYLPGSSAKVLVNSPFAGRLVICLESDHILQQQVVEMTGTTHTLEFALPADLRGGAFVSAIVVRPLQLESAQWLPHRAVGLARLKTDHAAERLPVKLLIPEQVRPASVVTVRVESAPAKSAEAPGAVHVWAVDEGILMTTGFETPQAFPFFWGQRQRSVDSYDLYRSLLPDQKRPADLSRIGGDGGEDLNASASRRSLVPPAKIKSAIVWQGTIPLDAAGNAEFTANIPDYTGELRWMSVAAEGQRMGGTERSMTVAAPLLVEAAWPRFVAPGDRFQVPVKLFNTTTAPLSVRLGLSVAGPAQVTLTSAELNPTIQPGEPLTLQLPILAGSSGTVQARVQVTGQTTTGEALTAHSTGDFPVRPGTPLETVSRSLIAEAGQPLLVEPEPNFLPGTAQTTVQVSAQPGVNLQPVISQLLDYPYGCLEQTSSKLSGLLVAEQLLQQEPHTEQRQALVGNMIDAGIYRLWSMQRRDGGLTYWPGNGPTYPWGTVYAAAVLSDAASAGHTLPSNFQKELGDYLLACLTGQNGTECDLGTKASMVRVLAAFERPQESWMLRLNDQVKSLDMEGRADLAWAWHLAGRTDLANELLTEEVLNLALVETYDGRITSGPRQVAHLLRAIVEIDPQHPWVPVLAARLEQSRQGTGWGTTLGNASALLALIKAQQATPAAEYTGTLELQGQPVGEFSHLLGARWSGAAPHSPFHVKSQGKGPVFVSISTTGLSATLRPAEGFDRQIAVRRRWLKRDGQPVDVEQLRVGDLIFTEVTLKSLVQGHDSRIPNVAIVDTLPGGVEVEHPRLQTSAVAEGAGVSTSEAEHVEFLDDRVVIMAAAEAREKTFRYGVRVTSVGTFSWPAIQASCMYRESWASVHGGGNIAVKPAQ